MKVFMAQLNFTIGDMVGNTKLIIDVIDREADRCDLIVFSEMCVTGYYPKDLLLREGFVEAQDKAIVQIKAATAMTNAAVIIGTIQKNKGFGKPFFNALELIDNGETVFSYHKQLLPTYGVFDEARHFKAGQDVGIYTWRGIKLGFLLCEDAWGEMKDSLYKTDPVANMVPHKPELVISINASPSYIGKDVDRHTLIQGLTIRLDAPVLYINQVGGMDELVFDGSSSAYDKQGNIVAMAKAFLSDGVIYETGQVDNIPFQETGKDWLITEQLRMGLADYCKKCGFESVVVGSSGGIDSAVTLSLCVLALGPDAVKAVTMPSQYSSAGSVDDSKALCDSLGVELFHASIKDAFDIEVRDYREAFQCEPSDLAKENIQARIRGSKLMTFSNSKGAMVVSTGNKSEISLGYCTLYGDMAGGLSILGDLYKENVYSIAKYLNTVDAVKNAIPIEIIQKEPSAELSEDQKDSDSLPPYYQLDAFLELVLEADSLRPERVKHLQNQIRDMRTEEKDWLLAKVDQTEYKRRQGAPIIKVSRKAYGPDRQVPIAINLSKFQ